MSHFLLTPFGSSGDVNPFIWLGSLLKERGHEVEVIAMPMFRETVARAGLEFTGVGDEEELLGFLHHPDLWRPYHGTKLVLEYGMWLMRPCFDAIAARIRGRGTVVVSPFHLFAARLAREKFHVPLVAVHLQPACFMSAHDMPLMIPGTGFINHLPVWSKRLMLALPNPMIRHLTPALRQVCAEEGIVAPRRPIPDWMHSPDVNLALFPGWFAPPQPDWPEHTHLVGFPLEDLRGQFELPAELQAWLAEGPKPVIFSPGTGNAQAREFFKSALEACQILGCRALLGTRFPEQLPGQLPSFARQFDYLPFSALLPHVSAIVHHGGIGTLAQGLAAGVPQLIMPMAHDQPDNARRAQRLGVAESLAPSQFTPGNVARILRRLVRDPAVAAACARVAGLCQAEDVATRAGQVLDHF